MLEDAMPHTVSDDVAAAVAAEPQSLGEGGRYRVISRLGSGGFGTVYLATDSRYGSPVAVKVLSGRSPATLYRFKQEFRSLADLDHPNLVKLYELSSEGWFVVMEYLDGADLLTHLGRAAATGAATVDEAHARVPLANLPSVNTVDPTEVRRVFGQLALGLMSLHAARKLHRDIKPSNVMVTREGRVVLLDFGLIADEESPLNALHGRGAGTPSFMSPEQRAGGDLTASSDWYAVGATLFTALTGWPPGADSSRSISSDNDSEALKPLFALCRRLLDPDPARRPAGPEVLESLGINRHSAETVTAQSVELVGRDDALRVLDEAFARSAEAPVLLRVQGDSGVGKTALLDAWLGRASRRDPRVWVLRSRCLENEHIPFKAVDGIIDALVAGLLNEPEARRRGVIPREGDTMRWMTTMFPVLAELDGSNPGASEPAGRDPRILRDQALSGLGALFDYAARDRPLILHIDDAHWGDLDSARALAAILQPTTKGLLLIIGQRPSHDPEALPAALDSWLAHGASGIDVREIKLSELNEAEARQLALSCLPDDAPPDEGLLRQIATEAGGSPFFIRQLAHNLVSTVEGEARPAQSVGFSALLERQLARQSPSVRRLVEVLSLAARPVPEDVASRAAGVAPSEVRAALQTALRQRLITGAVSHGAPSLETGHARIREEIVRTLSPATARAHHLSLADSLIASGEREPEVLLPHLLGADARDRAAEAAQHAALRAEKVFAFERAAELYEIVLTLGVAATDRAQTLERRGDALAHAGRSAAAAGVLHEALLSLESEQPRGTLSIEQRRARRTLERRCGELWLRSGHVTRGTERLKGVLQELEITLAASEKEALRTAMWRRVRLMARGTEFTPRPEREVPAEVLERLDALWGAATSLSMLRFMIADALSLQHLHEALEAGEPTRVLRSLSMEASFEALLGGGFFDRRCARMLDQMDQIARGVDAPYVRAWSLMSRGVVGWLQGDWRTSWSACRDAYRVYEAQSRGLVWELAVCDVYGLSAATYLGRFADLAAMVPASHRAARERGDLYATANLAFYESFVMLSRDEPAAAIRCAEVSIEPFIEQEYLANRYGIAYAMVQGEIYRGHGEAAWAIIERDWAQWATTGMLRAQCIRVEVRYLRARAALLTLADTTSRGVMAWRKRRSARAALREDLRSLGRDQIPPAAPMALAARAGVAHLDGQTHQALELLRRAAIGFDRCGMKTHLGAAHQHIARLSQGASDVDTAERSTQGLSREGVARPERMFHLVLPGFGA